jgi:cell division protein FtsI/penicillin-binding protein 2
MNRRTPPRSLHRRSSPPRRPSTSHQRRHRAIGFAVLAGVAVGAAAGIAAGDDRPRPTLGVGAAATATTAAETDSKPGASTDDMPRDLDRQRVPLDQLPDLLVGDGALRGHIDLSSMTRAGDGYEVRLAGGRRARLTLDPRLQSEAEKILVRTKAPMSTIVMMAPDGRILALAGRRHGPPARDDAYDLATTVWAPAASIFKLVTAAALLQAGVGASQPICYHGGLRSVMASNLRDDPRRDRHCDDLTHAVAESQNAIVAKLAHKFLDGDKLAAAARAFGLGKRAAFALDCESSRFQVPDDELERARFAAGFWSSELSALDGAILTSVVATRGMRVTPRLVAEVVEPSGKVRQVVSAAPERAIPARVATEIGHMMVKTTESGTAYRAFHDRRGRAGLHGIKVAGKTGSLDRDKPSYVGYSWFVGYAPADKPEVIVSVLFGNPAAWWLKAHTAARMLLDVAFASRAPAPG